MDNNKQLEESLVGALQPVTDARRQAALDAFAFRDLDTALAELIEDAPALLLRSDDELGAQQLRFSTPDGSVSIDVEATSAATATVVALCSVDPAYTGCDLVGPDGVAVTADITAGAAVFIDVPAGATRRVEFRRGGAVVAVTPWLNT